MGLKIEMEFRSICERHQFSFVLQAINANPMPQDFKPPPSPTAEDLRHGEEMAKMSMSTPKATFPPTTPPSPFPLATSEEISLEINDLSFRPIHVGTFTGTFTPMDRKSLEVSGQKTRHSAGSSTPAVITITQDNTVSVVFQWPGKPPSVPTFEEKEKQEFQKKYYLMKSHEYSYSVQNEECYFNKLELNKFNNQSMTLGGILFNREGEKVGKFINMSKKQQQSRRKSFSRQATVKVDDTLSKFITLKKHPITNKLFWYLTISFDISAITWICCLAGLESNVFPVLFFLFSFLWFCCFGLQMFLLLDDFPNQKEAGFAYYLVLPPGLLWALIFGAGCGEGWAATALFSAIFFSVFVGIPVKICCGFPKTETTFLDAIGKTGVYCVGFAFGLIYVGMLLVSLFAGTLYVYTTPYQAYTAGGLFVSFAVLPPIIYPVMYIIGYIQGVLHEWKWHYIIIPVFIINFILPFCVFMVGST